MKHGNQPAFPRAASEYTANGTLHDGNDAIREQDGMTKREYFAAMALIGIRSNPNPVLTNAEAVEMAIDDADELIKQLNS